MFGALIPLAAQPASRWRSIGPTDCNLENSVLVMQSLVYLVATDAAAIRDLTMSEDPFGVPAALTESVQACFSCQNSGWGYCMTSGTCEWLSHSPCGNEPSDYVTPSETTEQVLWENGIFPSGHDCFAVHNPQYFLEHGISSGIFLDFIVSALKLGAFCISCMQIWRWCNTAWFALGHAVRRRCSATKASAYAAQHRARMAVSPARQPPHPPNQPHTRRISQSVTRLSALLKADRRRSEELAAKAERHANAERASAEKVVRGLAPGAAASIVAALLFWWTPLPLAPLAFVPGTPSQLSMMPALSLGTGADAGASWCQQTAPSQGACPASHVPFFDFLEEQFAIETAAVQLHAAIMDRHGVCPVVPPTVEQALGLCSDEVLPGAIRMFEPPEHAPIAC